MSKEKGRQFMGTGPAEKMTFENLQLRVEEMVYATRPITLAFHQQEEAILRQPTTARDLLSAIHHIAILEADKNGDLQLDPGEKGAVFTIASTRLDMLRALCGKGNDLKATKNNWYHASEAKLMAMVRATLTRAQATLKKDSATAAEKQGALATLRRLQDKPQDASAEGIPAITLTLNTNVPAAFCTPPKVR